MSKYFYLIDFFKSLLYLTKMHCSCTLLLIQLQFGFQTQQICKRLHQDNCIKLKFFEQFCVIHVSWLSEIVAAKTLVGQKRSEVMRKSLIARFQF